MEFCVCKKCLAVKYILSVQCELTGLIQPTQNALHLGMREIADAELQKNNSIPLLFFLKMQTHYTEEVMFIYICDEHFSFNGK